MCSLRLAVTVTVLALAMVRVRAEYIVDIADFFQDCDNGQPAPAFNTDELQTLQDDDGNSVLNGNMVFEGEYNDPVEVT